MKKKLKIQFWKAEKVLVMQILMQDGLPDKKTDGYVRILDKPNLCDDGVVLRGVNHDHDLDISYIYFNSNIEGNKYLEKVITNITEELFTSISTTKTSWNYIKTIKKKVEPIITGAGNVQTYYWEEK
mgnify:CR=1 FL=1|jgi:hypothetical protein